MKDKYHLFLSPRNDKKLVMLMPSLLHSHHFGSRGYRDYTLMSDKNSNFYEPKKVKRDQIKASYLKRHSKDNKSRHSPSSMSDVILWNKDTLLDGIKAYERKFNVEIVFNNKKLTEAVKQKLFKKEI